MLTPEHKAAIDKYISTDHNGKPIDKKALLKPNHMIARALVARIASMSPEQGQALKAIVTPQSSGVLKILLPELAKLIDKDAGNG